MVTPSAFGFALHDGFASAAPFASTAPASIFLAPPPHPASMTMIASFPRVLMASSYHSTPTRRPTTRARPTSGAEESRRRSGPTALSSVRYGARSTPRPPARRRGRGRAAGGGVRSRLDALVHRTAEPRHPARVRDARIARHGVARGDRGAAHGARHGLERDGRSARARRRRSRR